MINQTSNSKGFTLVEIMIVVAVVGLLVGLAVPNFVRSRQSSQTSACINNQRVIQHAKEQWTLLSNGEDTDTPVATDLDTYLKGGTDATYCPTDPDQTFATSYTINPVDTAVACLISPSDHSPDAPESEEEEEEEEEEIFVDPTPSSSPSEEESEEESPSPSMSPSEEESEEESPSPSMSPSEEESEEESPSPSMSPSEEESEEESPSPSMSPSEEESEEESPSPSMSPSI